MPSTADSEGRIAISEVTTAGWSFTEDVRAYGNTPGVDGIGVWRDKLAASDLPAETARDRIDAAGLDACSLVYAGGFTDPDTFESDVEDAREAIRTAEILGAPAVLVVAGPRLDVTVAEGDRLVREALQRLAPSAREAGVTLGLEPIHPVRIAEYSTVVTLSQAREIVADIDAAGILLDLWNSWWEPELRRELEAASEQIAAVQVGDFRAESDEPLDRAVPGEGIVPFGELIDTLEATGYDGWYEIELFTDHYEPGEYRRLLDHCVSGVEGLLSG